MEAVIIAAVQAAPVFLDRDATVQKAAGLVEEAAAEGARLIAFPETFVPTYPDWVWRSRPWDDGAADWFARLLDQSVVVPSPVTDVLGEAAPAASASCGARVTGRGWSSSTPPSATWAA